MRRQFRLPEKKRIDVIIPMKGHTPNIAHDVFVAPTAVIVGNVEIGEGSSIWYGAVLRGDCGRIVIGKGSNVQDNATVHTPDHGETVIGDNVTVGHGAVLEGCVIENGALIGMNAVVLHGTTIGENSMIAAGSVIKEFSSVPPRTLAAGVPARVKKDLEGSSEAWVNMAAGRYREFAVEHREAVEALEVNPA